MAYPTVNKTLMALAKSAIKVGMVSDAPSREAWMRIYYLNLYHFFDVVITLDDSGERKPSAKPFQMALDRMGLRPEETVMIGDWPERDVVGAQQIGMKTAFARYGDTFGTLQSGADWDLDDIYQLVGIINEFNSGG